MDETAVISGKPSVGKLAVIMEYFIEISTKWRGIANLSDDDDDEDDDEDEEAEDEDGLRPIRFLSSIWLPGS